VGSSLELRAQRHHALADVHRLAIVDELELSDRTPSELLAVTGLPSNLLAFHLDVLEGAGLVSRHGSHGDRRRRYVTLDDEALSRVEPAGGCVEVGEAPVLFVCTGNSARSQLAAALWRDRTGRVGLSAGAAPASEVHHLAIEVAARHGLDLSAARPRGYDQVDLSPALVVSVCDRAREGGVPFDAPTLHWSVPDPAGGDIDDFEAVVTTIRRRIDRLAEAAA
jgi:protein-tyrosine-phosphatase